MAGDDAAGQRKGGGGTTPPQLPPPAEQGLRCPRCDSPNTKFCYYNNYSLSQPRHFCKTCRRYWTKGGALRNVPVGGGCRKNKRSRSAAAAAVAAAAASSSSSSRLSLNLPPMDGIGCAGTDLASGARMGFLGGGGSGIVSSSSPLGGDFQGAVGMVPIPRLHGAPAVGVTQYVPFGEWPSSSADITGGAMNGGAMSSTIASSIESLSFINQDLHWKLQQQRLATMFLGPPPSSSSVAHVDGGNNSQAAGQHAAGGGGTTFLQMAGSSSGMEPMPAATSWFMDGCSYAFPSPPPPPAAAMGLTTSSNINSGRSSGGGGDDNAATSNNNNNCGSAIPAWGDISVFAMLP